MSAALPSPRRWRWRQFLFGGFALTADGPGKPSEDQPGTIESKPRIISLNEQ
jgi:hypothetical protein